MLKYLLGTITEKSAHSITIEVQGIGFTVIVRDLLDYELNKYYKIYTYLILGDKETKLIGFKSLDEYNLFSQLIKIKGIGVKSIFEIENSMTPIEFYNLIDSDNSKPLLKIKGIGVKTIDSIFKYFNKNKSYPFINEINSSLKSLGYSSDEIKQAMKLTIYPDNIQLNEAIRLTLKNITK